MSGKDRSVTIAFQPNAADFRRILFWYHWKRLVLVAIAWLIICVPILYLVGFGAGGSSLGTNSNAPLIVFAFLLALPLMTVLSAYFGIYRQAKKIERIAEPVTVTFSHAGIEAVAESYSSKRTWDGIKKVVETKEDFIFLPHNSVFFAVPRRFFSSEVQAEDLKELLRTNLGQRAKLRS